MKTLFIRGPANAAVYDFYLGMSLFASQLSFEIRLGRRSDWIERMNTNGISNEIIDKRDIWYFLYTTIREYVI